MKPDPCVLTIAGSDSGAGAGVQADARTIHALGGFACMAITAITAQNTRGVHGWSAVAPKDIEAQVAAVIGNHDRERGALPVRAVKTGLLPGADAVKAVVRSIANFQRPLVVDPVIGSTSGTRFLDDAGLRVLTQRLLPLATLVTPNWPEAEALTGMEVRSYLQVEAAAQRLVEQTGSAVLVKGGHGPGKRCRDCLVTTEGRVCWFESARVTTPNTHGTGCVLASAIATELAKGETLLDAVENGRDFLQRSLREHRATKWGGAGPAFPG